jgi:hypothetical protein
VREIFQTTFLPNRNDDITAAGKRLLLQVPDRTDTAAQQIAVVLHWAHCRRIDDER